MSELVSVGACASWARVDERILGGWVRVRVRVRVGVRVRVRVRVRVQVRVRVWVRVRVRVRWGVCPSRGRVRARV